MMIKKIYGCLLTVISKCCGIGAAKKFDARLRFGKALNLKNPQSLADKVSFIELYDQSPLAPMCSDKYEVRKYVKEKGLEDLLIPLMSEPLSDVRQFELKKLPEKFVMKATHGCKMNLIVKDKNHVDERSLLNIMRKWLGTTYGKYSVEPHYYSIPHRIIFEDFLESPDGLVDYKFHCLNGIPKFVLVCTDRKSRGDKKMVVTRFLYDMDWNPIDAVIHDKEEVSSSDGVTKPQNFDRMVEIAEILSKDFKFVRVDLYEVDGSVRFGELTFTPACCLFTHFTDEFNNQMGKLLKI